MVPLGLKPSAGQRGEEGGCSSLGLMEEVSWVGICTRCFIGAGGSQLVRLFSLFSNTSEEVCLSTTSARLLTASSAQEKACVLT